MRKSLEAKDTKLTHRNPAGLDKENVAKQINEAAATGNSEVELKGTTPEGDTVTGNNRDFSLKVSAEGLPEKDIDRAVRLVSLYKDYLERGTISEDVAENVDDKIRRMRRSDRGDA
jgi:Na+/phosphate symporter